MLPDPASTKRAGALAFSLTVQTVVAGTLMVIPLLYTDHLPLVQLQLPVFLTLAPPPPEPPEPTREALTQRIERAWRPLTMPTRVPPLNTQPEVIDKAPIFEFTPGLSSSSLPPPVLEIPRVAPPPPPLVQVVESAPSKPVVVSSEVQAAKLIRKVMPVYPRLAIIGRVSGTVRLVGMISTAGTIEKLEVLGGPSLLVQAAVDAVRQWTYRPTVLNGKPVEVVAPIDVRFALTQ